jgi:hypothetical protein
MIKNIPFLNSGTADALHANEKKYENKQTEVSVP